MNPYHSIVGATGSRAYVLFIWPKARLVKIGQGEKYPIFALWTCAPSKGGKKLIEAEGITNAWKAGEDFLQRNK